jgi:hypothetical protein
MNLYYLLFTIIIAAIAIEPHFLHWVHLHVLRFEHLVESKVLQVKLLAEIYLDRFYMKIGYVPKKYYDMASEIRKDLGLEDE